MVEVAELRKPERIRKRGRFLDWHNLESLHALNDDFRTAHLVKARFQHAALTPKRVVGPLTSDSVYAHHIKGNPFICAVVRPCQPSDPVQ